MKKPVPKCSACGGTKNLRRSMWHGDQPICRYCFMVWYDPPGNIDVTDPAAVGRESLRLKAERAWPWVSYLDDQR